MSNSISIEKSFRDLAPVEDGDISTYESAIDFALSSPRVKNIAITGPYGSGKSSIIRTYEETHKEKGHRFLNISLATFKDEEAGDENRSGVIRENAQQKTNPADLQHRLIEQSILQQMLYGADSQKLPYSRFRRISKPIHPYLKAIGIAVWLTLLFVLQKNVSVIWGFDFSVKWWSFTSISILFLIMTTGLIAEFYKVLFKTPIKKISLPKGEFETAELPEGSILNKHLDEIIYFFQETDYNVVVIEDLDRFGSPEIFIKLREINKLINDNLAGKASKKKPPRSVKFLYALKDDMFLHNDRAKFFDFIIPVVPVINSSNSLDKIIQRIKGQPYAAHFDKDENKQFLRDVSWDVYDLRLIHNIFNEFNVYYSKLNSESLNATKLLAMLIYKNVYPNDFELLHNGKGALYSIARKRNELIASTKASISEKIEKLQDEIQRSENEMVKSVEELIKGFIGHLAIISPQPANAVYLSTGTTFMYSQLLNWDNFQQLLNVSNFEFYSNYHHNRHSAGKTVQQIIAEISPNESFPKRKKNIENKGHEKRIILEAEIRYLEKEKAEVVQLPLFKLLQKHDISVESMIEGEKLRDPRLFVYLVKNGYIDDAYHQYTSNFHEGRLTKNDRDFLLAIRDFKTPDPIQVIDTPDEVCNNMREEDFSHKYALNVTLMDYLFTDKEKGSGRIKSAISYIATNFSESEEFFNAYWNAGKSVADFTRLLSEQWPAYGTAALKSANATSHIALIFTHVTPKNIIGKMNNEGVLTQHLSKHGHLVFASDLYSLLDFDVYKKLGVKFENLSSLEKHETHLEFAHTNDLYEISQSNISFLMKRYSSERDSELHTNSNYTVLSKPGCEKIKKYVDANLPVYINEVFLNLASNTKESGEAIKSLLNNTALDLDTKKAIVSQEEHVFPDFSDVPTELWTTLLAKEKIGITWPNVSEYFGIDDADKELLTQKVFSDKWLNKLSESKFESDKPTKEHQLSLARFFLGNDDIDNRLYTILVRQTPYNWNGFHDVSTPKMKILVEEKKVSLCKATYDTAIDDKSLVASLIEKNSTAYFKAKSDYPIDDSVIEILLRSTLTSDQKIDLCHDVTEAGINSSKNLAKIMGELLAPDSVDCSEIDDQILKALIANVQPVDNSIRLLNKVIPTWTEPDTMAAIATLPDPYADIANYGKRPKLTKNDLNTRFAELLKSNGFISKSKDEDSSIRIITFNSADHSKDDTNDE